MQETARPVREGDLGEGAEATAAAAATGGQVAAPGDGERSKGHERRPLKHFGLDHVQAVIQFAVLSRALGFRLSGRHVDQVAGLFVLRSDELLRGDAFEIAAVFLSWLVRMVRARVSRLALFSAFWAVMVVSSFRTSRSVLQFEKP